MESANDQCDTRVAEVIASKVSKLEEVEFGTGGSNSLMKAIAGKLKLKNDSKLLSKVKRWWTSPSSTLVKKVTEILRKKSQVIINDDKENIDMKITVDNYENTEPKTSDHDKTAVSDIGSMILNEKNQAKTKYDIAEERKNDEPGKENRDLKPLACNPRVLSDGINHFQEILIVGDGNCLFRCLSYIQCGTQSKHQEIRRELVDYTAENWLLEYPRVKYSNPILCQDENEKSDGNAEEDEGYRNAEHYRDMMGRNGEFGTLYEAGLFVRIHNVKVQVFIEGKVKGSIVKVDGNCSESDSSCHNILLTQDLKKGHWVVLTRVNENIEKKCNKSMKKIYPGTSEIHLINSTNTLTEKKDHSLQINNPTEQYATNCRDKDEIEKELDECEYEDAETKIASFDLQNDEDEKFRKICEEVVQTYLKKDKTEYQYDIGTVEVPSSIFKNLFGELDNHILRKSIELILLYDLLCTCSIRFYGGVRKNKFDVVAYAECKHADHQANFKFRIHHIDEPSAFVHVMSTDELKYVHKNTVASTCYVPLRGEERKEWAEKASQQGVRNFQKSIVLKIDSGLMYDGHMQNLRRDHVMYKATSEIRTSQRCMLVSLDLRDAFELWIQHQKKKDPFLRHVALPLTAIMYSLQELNLLLTQKNAITHIDATGSVTRDPQDVDCKKILYYCLLIKHDEEIIKLTHMITSEHGIQSISNWLHMYKYFVMAEAKKWPVMKCVVTDWSWVFLHSTCKTWNDITLLVYIAILYDFIINKDNKDVEKRKPLPKGLIHIKICCAHFTHLVSRSIKQNMSDFVHNKLEEKRQKEVKNFLLDCVSLLILCRKIQDMDAIFQHICSILLAPEKADAADGIKALNLCIKKSKIPPIEEKDDDEMGNFDFEQEMSDFEQEFEIAASTKRRAMYEQSPFYNHFKDIRKNYKKKDSKVSETVSNDFYAPEFLKYLLKQWMPYVILWSGLDLDEIDAKIDRLSNAYIESSTKIFKEDVLDGNTKLCVGDVIRAINNDRETTAGVVRIGAKIKGTKLINPKAKYPENIPNPDPTEGWDNKSAPDMRIAKKKTKTKGHFKAPTISKEIDKIDKESMISGENKKKRKSITKGKQQSDQKKKSRKGKAILKKIGKIPQDLNVTSLKSKKKGNEKEKIKSLDAEINLEDYEKRGIGDFEISNHSSIATGVTGNKTEHSSNPKLQIVEVTSSKILENSIPASIKSELIEDGQENGEQLGPDIDFEISTTTSSADFHTLATAVIGNDTRSSQSTNIPLELGQKCTEIDVKYKNEIQQEKHCVFRKFPNSIIADETYYFKSSSSNVAVSKYTSKNLAVMNVYQLRAREFTTLRYGIWIDGQIIDSFVASCIDAWDDVTYISTDSTSFIIGSHSGKRVCTKRRICKIDFEIKEILLMPYLLYGHWRLCVVNTVDGKVAVLDPYGEDKDYARVVKAFQYFIENSSSSFSKLKNKKWSKWEIQNRPYQKCNDGHGCGAYIIYYLECFGYKKPLTLDFDPKTYRLQVAHSLLLLSENMADICMYCFADIKTDEYIVCRYCDRKCEKRCLMYNDMNTDDENEKDNEKKLRKRKITKAFCRNETLECRLCRKFHERTDKSEYHEK